MRSKFRKIPVLAYGKSAVLKFQQVSGRKLLDVQKRSRRVRDVSELHVLPKCLAIDSRQFGRDRENGFDFRTKQQALAVEYIVQRLFSQAVARNEDFAPTLVIEGEREHTSQLVHAIPSHLLVQMNNYF